MRDTSTLTSLLAFLSLALAAPTTAPESFTPSIRNKIQGLNGGEIRAHNGTFTINGPSSGHCPLTLPDCAAKLMTWVYPPTTNGEVFLATVTSTQQLYISSSDSLGSLAYIPAIQDSQGSVTEAFPVPDDVVTRGFTRVESDEYPEDYNTDHSPYLRWRGKDWYVCGDEKIYPEAWFDLGYKLGADCEKFWFRLDRHRMGSDGRVLYYA